MRFDDGFFDLVSGIRSHLGGRHPISAEPRHAEAKHPPTHQAHGRRPCGRKDTPFWDRDLAGFGVRVHATGRKCYVVRSRGPAGLKWVTLGRHGVLATEAARKQAAVVIDRLKRGEAPTPAPPVPPLTVAALAERFLRVHVQTHCKPNTARTYRGHFDRHILPVLGVMTLGSVGRAEVAALHHRLRATPTTANAVVRTLSVMLTLAETWVLVPPERNPCRAVRRYKQHPSSGPRSLSSTTACTPPPPPPIPWCAPSP